MQKSEEGSCQCGYLRQLEPTPESTRKALTVAVPWEPAVLLIKEIFGPKEVDDVLYRFPAALQLYDQGWRGSRVPPMRGASFLSVLVPHICLLLCSLN